MKLLYNIGMLLYWLAIHIAAPFHGKAAKWVKGRRELFSQLEQVLSKRGNRPLAWFHCASLGEFEQGRPVIEALRVQHPEYFILVTFFSPSGYDVRKNYNGADHVCYMPVDLPRTAKRFVNMVNPTIAIFVKYEFWYNHLNALKQAGAKTYVISAIFRENQAFFDRLFGALFVQMLHFCEHIFVQNKESLSLLADIGVYNASYSGDTRFDRVLTVAATAKTLPQLTDFAQNQIVLVAGSTWPPDENLLADMVNKSPDLKLIIAPHEIGESGIKHTLSLFQKPAITYSELQKNPSVNLADYSVFVVDAIGFLASLYRFGAMAYIGGGFGVGIHNTLEAAVYGVPVIFGSNYQRFKEAVDLVEQGGAFSVANLPELQQVVGRLRNDKTAYDNSCSISKAYVQQRKGATDIIMQRIFAA